MTLRFEFDRINKVLLLRVEGRVTDESAATLYEAVRKYATATDASAGIVDFSTVTEFDVSPEFIRETANQEPAMPDPTRPRFVVAPTRLVFGMARMFQLLGEHTRPLLQVVHTLDVALAALGVQSPHFEPLE